MVHPSIQCLESERFDLREVFDDYIHRAIRLQDVVVEALQLFFALVLLLVFESVCCRCEIVLLHLAQPVLFLGLNDLFPLC